MFAQENSVGSKVFLVPAKTKNQFKVLPQALATPFCPSFFRFMGHAVNHLGIFLSSISD